MLRYWTAWQSPTGLQSCRVSWAPYAKCMSQYRSCDTSTY